MTIPQAYESALQHHQAGRLAEAEALYRQILSVQPEHADALHHLGIIALQAGHCDSAVELIHRAVVLNPNHPGAYANLGEAYRAAGRLEEAVTSYHRALRLKASPETENNLGNALKAQGRLDEAVAAYSRALQLMPDHAIAYFNLGLALAEQGRLDEAVAAYRRALEIKPDYPEAHNNLGAALNTQGRVDEATIAYRRALQLRPDYAGACDNLGIALAAQGQFDEAITAHRRAIELQPDRAEAHTNLGNVLRDSGRLQEAIAAFERALELKPNAPEIYNHLGIALAENGQVCEAVAAYRRAIELKPDYSKAHNNLGNALGKMGRLDEAIAALRQALELRPDRAETHNNLGNALKDRGQLDEGIAMLRRALELQPDRAEVHSNLIYALHFRPGQGGEAIDTEQQRWNDRFGEPLKKLVKPHTNTPNPERRLKIGYVSPDFRAHSVSFFFTPLLEAHDRDRYEIYCYANVRRPDPVTQRQRKSADAWRDVCALSDAQLTERVRSDGIDILVDLAMHTEDNRLLAFARKPAPVQVSWLAYPGSTGLEAIDYRLTDAHIDPPGRKDTSHRDRPVRLPDCWCCYAPIPAFPAVSSLPAERQKGLTFGSLNQFGKVNEHLLRCWARLLEAVPGSRLLMACPDGVAMPQTYAIFGAHRIPQDRVELIAPCPWPDYVRLLERIDIALDSYPCNGMTTTCHALWMGVPVVTWVGTRAASRAGSSLLHTIGLSEWVAQTEEEYFRIATQWANDLPRLAELRSTLRSRMRASPLMDAPRFARNIEAAYRAMWRRWCAWKHS